MSSFPPVSASPSRRAASGGAVAPGWRIAAPALAVALVVAVALLWPGLASMVEVWDRSGTYTHGFLILPISVYLVWRNRIAWLPVAPRPLWWMLPVLAVLGLGWFASAVTDLVGGEHATAVLMLMGVVAFFAGRDVARLWLFPLAYLIFAIPFGEALLPPLMSFTADFTVIALQLVGVPVYREGLYFSVPSGNWSVVEACSGLRYLIASLALGTLYAYLSYRSVKRRAIFVVVSGIIPILANGFRAFMIVMIGHLSNMKLATGIDHYIYGWVFFALVTFLLFWVGGRWREDTEPVAPSAATVSAQGAHAPSAFTWGLALVLCLAAVAAGPLAGRSMEARLQSLAPRAELARLDSTLPDATNFAGFKPHFVGERASWARETGSSTTGLGLFAAYYVGQDEGHKLISSTNKLVPTSENRWALVYERRTSDRAGDYLESEVRGARWRILAWQWYRICGADTANPVWAKWLQLRCILTEGRDDAAVFVVYTPVEADAESARGRLRSFLEAQGAALRAAVDGGRSTP